MVRQQIYLTKHQKKYAKVKARQEGSTQAEVIRRLINIGMNYDETLSEGGLKNESIRQPGKRNNKEKPRHEAPAR